MNGGMWEGREGETDAWGGGQMLLYGGLQPGIAVTSCLMTPISPNGGCLSRNRLKAERTFPLLGPDPVHRPGLQHFFLHYSFNQS